MPGRPPDWQAMAHSLVLLTQCHIRSNLPSTEIGISEALLPRQHPHAPFLPPVHEELLEDLMSIFKTLLSISSGDIFLAPMQTAGHVPIFESVTVRLAQTGGAMLRNKECEVRRHCPGTPDMEVLTRTVRVRSLLHKNILALSLDFTEGRHLPMHRRPNHREFPPQSRTIPHPLSRGWTLLEVPTLPRGLQLQLKTQTGFHR